jgi:Flp pilus assembly protein TadD
MLSGNWGRPLVNKILFLSLLLVAGCATTPSPEDAPAIDAEAVKAARELYSGEPPIVHATEFPVDSALDGLKRGDDAWRTGDLDLALYLYVQALGFDARTVEPLLRIATIHETRGNRVLARKAFEMALVRDPKNAGASERLGLLCLQDEQSELAGTFFARAIALEPQRWRSHSGLGVVADRAGDHVSAIRHYDSALRLEPKAAPVMNNRGYSKFLAGDFTGAEADLRQAIRLGARGEAWVNIARVQARQRKYAEALESLLFTFEVPQAQNALGEAAMENGDYSRAKEYFEAASDSAPSYFEAAQKNLALANQKLSARLENRGN